MKLFITGILVAVCLARSVYSTTDFCKTSCGDKNIGCHNDDKLKSGCPKGASVVNYTSADKQYVLDLHNDYRNAVSNGSVNGFSPSARMAKMSWDDELAYLAAINTRNCTFAHDACRNTDKFKMAGQNLGIYGSSPNQPTVREAIQKAISGFFNEYNDTSMDDIRSFRSAYSTNGKMIGHYTQVIWSNSTAVGCGSTRFPRDGFNYIVTACNYAVGNVVGWPVYLISSKPASGCKTGTDSKYKALCSDKENIDPNNYYRP